MNSKGNARLLLYDQISAVPEIVWCIAFISTLLYAKPIIIKVFFDRRIVFDMYAFTLSF